jgi:hypothetical protein
MAKKNLRNIHPFISVLCEAIRLNNQCIIDHLNRKNKNDHQFIDSFQDGIYKYLNTLNPQYSDYIWAKEKKANGRKERDSIDIFGESKDELCIIEIDATRIDQIAQKYVSRLCLWGLETRKKLLYVAILYKGSSSHSRIEDCEKYMRYCNEISKKSKGKDSSVIGIYTDGYTIEVWDFDVKSRFQITYPDNKKPEFSTDMSIIAKNIIQWCAANNKVTTFDDAKYIFGNAVSRKECASKDKEVITKNGDSIYVSKDWREYGQRAYWNEFIDNCKKLKIQIEKQVIIYQPVIFEKFIYGSRKI